MTLVKNQRECNSGMNPDTNYWECNPAKNLAMNNRECNPVMNLTMSQWEHNAGIPHQRHLALEKKAKFIKMQYRLTNFARLGPEAP